MRDSHKTVNFTRAFRLRGLDGEQPAGTYDIITTEELVPSLWYEAWRRTATQIRIPRNGHDTGQTQLVKIQPQELDDALMSDRGDRLPRSLNFLRD